MKIKGSTIPEQNRRVRGRQSSRTTIGVIINLQNSQVLTLSLPTEEIFQVHSKIRPVSNLPVVGFCSQPQEMPVPKPLNTYLSVFVFVI